MSKDDETQESAPASPPDVPAQGNARREDRGTHEHAPPGNRVPECLTRVAPVTVPPTRIQVSPEVLADNFQALLESVSRTEAFGILELGRFRFGLRRRMGRELLALYAGLWNLALRRSFPHDYEEIFRTWLLREKARLPARRRREWEKRILQ